MELILFFVGASALIRLLIVESIRLLFKFIIFNVKLVQMVLQIVNQVDLCNLHSLRSLFRN